MWSLDTQPESHERKLERQFQSRLERNDGDWVSSPDFVVVPRRGV